MSAPNTHDRLLEVENDVLAMDTAFGGLFESAASDSLADLQKEHDRVCAVYYSLCSRLPEKLRLLRETWEAEGRKS